MERIVGDLKLFELKTMHLLVTLRDHVDHRPSLVRAARIAVNDVTCQSQDDLVSAVPASTSSGTPRRCQAATWVRPCWRICAAIAVRTRILDDGGDNGLDQVGSGLG